MKKSSLVTILFAFFAAFVLACIPGEALGQHRGRGSHGGGFHGGGFHGGSHGHSFHGLGHFGGGGHAHAPRSGHGFHSSGGGRSLVSSRGFRSTGGRLGGGNFGHRTNYSGRSSSGSSVTPFSHARTAFSPSAFRNAAANGHWRSFGAGRSSSFASERIGFSSGEGSWRSFGSRGSSSFASARSSPWEGSRSMAWSHERSRRPMTHAGWNAFSRSSRSAWDSNRLTSRGFSNAWSRPIDSAISTDRVLSNFQSRFNHSPGQRFGFTNARFGSRSSSFDRAGFGGRYGFRGDRGFGGGAFGDRDFWSGDNGFSFFPDLFGVALDLGGFGLRAFNFLGAGLNLLDLALSGDSGYGGYGTYGGYGGYGNNGGFGAYGGYDPGFNVAPPLVVSPYWIPDPIPYTPEGGIFYPR